MTLVDLADELAEVRRYVRSKPEYVRGRLEDMAMQADGVVSKDPSSRQLVWRVIENVFVGLRCYIFNDAGEFIASTNLHVLEGYLDGAVYEIRQYAERQRKERGE